MLDARQEFIARLTGIQSSKRNHYPELKARIAEVERRNVQLEILNGIARFIRVDMSLPEMISGVRSSLGRLLPSPRLNLHLCREHDPAVPAAARPVKRLQQHLEWVQARRETLLILPPGLDRPDVPCTCQEGPGPEATALVPLLTRRTLAGVLEVSCDHPAALLTVGIHFLEQLGDQLAAALVNSQLYAEVLQRQREWFQTFNAIKNPVVVLDRHGRVVQWNDAAVRFPLPAGDSPAGQPWWRIVLGAVEPEVRQAAAEAVHSGGAFSGRFQDEQGHLLDVSIYPLHLTAEKVEGAIVYAKDVSDEVRYQAQLIQSARLAAIGQLAAGVAHELNSPLTVVLGNAQLLLRSMPAGDPAQPLLQDILSCGMRCSRIVQNLLAFSRQDEYPFAPVDVNPVAERVIALLRHQLEGARVRVECELAPALPVVQGNEYQIEQVLINLILNARDAFAPGMDRRVVRVATGVREHPDGRRVTVAVTDGGSGIQPQHLRHLFHPFFTTKELGKGTGLGLWVSMGIARAHGGTIEVESEWGRGSTFTLVLPALAEGAIADAGSTHSVPDPGCGR